MKNFEGWVFFGKNKRKVFLKEKVSSTGSTIPPLIERILKRRGIEDAQIETFLNPKYENLYPYHKWHTLINGIDLIKWAISSKKKIHIHSDYDVDGITSLAMLYACIMNLGGNVNFSVSNRFKGGYGIPNEIFDKAFQSGCELFISLDCGTSSYELHNKAKKHNVPFLIIDHHPFFKKIDDFVLICNTHSNDCPPQFSKFSTAGIVFKLVNGLYNSFNLKFPYKSYLRLTSLGLAQDIVEMIGENHSIVSLGMKEMHNTKNPFLKALLKTSGLEGKTLNSNHLYYRLGPRLNAPGRMEDATFLIDLFLLKDENKIKEGIEKIETLNKLRQEIQTKIYNQICKKIKDEKIIVAYDPNWHLGVLGLVASKLAQEYNKISFCLTKDNGLIKGSGRSIQNFSLIDILKKAEDLLENYGGHNMACGLSLKEENFEGLKERLIDISKDYNFENEAGIEVEEVVTFNEIKKCIKFFEMLEPYGNKNPMPIFLSHNVRLYEKPSTYNNISFLKFAQENTIISGTGFNLEDINFPKEFSILYYPSIYKNNLSINFLGILE